jgi:hypothetical protein
MRSWRSASARGLVFVAVAVLTLGGCSKGDDDDDSSTSGSAVKKCNDFLQQFCDSVVGCEVEGGLVDAADQDSEVSSCMSEVSSTVDCSTAVDVSSSYDECMSRLANPPCADINQAIMDQNLELPTACNGAILTK